MEVKEAISYTADLYLRLSREDGDKGESDSISNQRSLLMDFLKTNGEIKLHKIRVDDGYSGIDFDRPDFIEMMESVKKQEINCIIVKDFSRLGRNFIETGKYIEKIFPFLGVRFISVIDHYDSARPKTSSDSLLIPVKNLMNDAYCQDISLKIRSSIDTKRKKGDCVAPFCVYGYRKNPQNRNHLIVDESVAGNIEDIFQRKLAGYSSQAIADWLNERGVLSPMEHKRHLGIAFGCPFRQNEKSGWTAVSVLRVLKNPVYIGTLEQGKRSRPNYKIKKPIHIPEEHWIKVEDNHEPIISKEIFALTAKVLESDTRTAPMEKTVYVLSGLMRCADCRRNIIRKNNYYICAGHKQKSGCTSHSISSRFLEEAVLTAIQQHIRTVIGPDTLQQTIEMLPHEARTVKNAKKGLLEKEAEIKKYRCYQLVLFEDYQAGIISQKDYCSFRARYHLKIQEGEQAIARQKEEIECLTEDNGKKNRNIEMLDRRLAVELIDSIYIYENHKVLIKFRFQDEYQRLVSLLLEKVVE